MAKISVIVPVYKVKEYLYDCINSILKQTFNDFELILIDDGCPDGCGLICDEYGKKDKRVTVIHKNNGGLSSARNAGLEYIFKNTNSEFITFVDGDDFLDENYLSELVKRSKNYDIIACDYNIYEINSIKETANLPTEYSVSNYKDYWALSEICHDLLIISCAKLFRRNVFKNIRYPIGLINEDNYLIHEIIGNSKNILILPDKLYFYRQRSGSIMATIKKSSVSHKINSIQVNNHIAEFYARITDWSFFEKFYRKNLDILMPTYFKHPILLRKYFKMVKSLFKIKKSKSNLIIRNGEKLFFSLPYVYSVFYFIKYKKG